jgi:pimeloyl-ACP methyl ester carboxylesterase
LLVRGLPREVAADGARHTWSSYSRTLRHVVIGHRVSGDLHHVAAPITVLHGREDRTAPLHHVHELVDELRSAGRNVHLDVVDGDHHLPVRQPDLVAAAIAAAQGPT